MDCVMTSSLKQAPIRQPEYTATRQRKLDRQLGRFPKRFRAAIQRASEEHTALADLALSFPALLFVIAVPHAKRNASLLKQCVIEGQHLKRLAAIAHVPMWARKLQPEAFEAHLGPLPQSEIYARQIVNHLPRRGRHSAIWMESVSLATSLGDESFAVWVARECGLKRPPRSEFRMLALWAWFSVRPHLAAAQHIAKAWSPHIKLKAARDASRNWFNRVKMHVLIADSESEILWLREDVVDGYAFLPLRTAKAIHEEADAMENCIDTYAVDIASDSQRLWSMRRDDKPVATISVGNCHDLGLLCITQIKGPKNEAVSRTEALAAMTWFLGNDTLSIEVKPKDWDTVIPNVEVWQSLFKPYWLEKKTIPRWLRLRPTNRDLNLR
jgi:hypothetical protein